MKNSPLAIAFALTGIISTWLVTKPEHETTA
jgi:hypothetical protein